MPDYETDDRELPFWIRYDDSDKENIDDLGSVLVYRPEGEPVRLENLADYGVYPGPGSIRRYNGKMTIGYRANAETEDFPALQARVTRHLKSLDLPDGFEISTRRDRHDDSDAIKSSILAGVLALLLVFFIMGMLFESFVLPFSVILTIPFAFFGSAWALYFSGITLDPVGIVGFVKLVGVVVNNAIVLVDTINRKRTLEGLDRTEAILQAAHVRFRPIWMTALTTIFGLLPLVILPQRGEGIDYKAMAIVLMGGLMTSTFFTLFVVPLFYTLLDDLQRALVTLLFGARVSRDESR